ncbi:MAG TPA: hypothetical protein VJQ56_02305, partial [Blastocatellia bacterium]|nr:hypothetical protein [Blastocatellia bacterium]
FLLDVFCLGVKNAFFRIMSEWEYETTLRSLKRQEDFEIMSAECVRKLVEDAVDYAKDLGFSPHSDYLLAGKIFGDIDKSACQMSFAFGQDGKPTYISGPYDSPAKSRRIINTLTERCGPDGFHYLMMIGSPSGDFDEEFDEEDGIDIEALDSEEEH